LRQFALRVAPGSLAPIGQHGLSITYDEALLLHDNGNPANFQHVPNEASRNYSSPRKYQLDLNRKLATEVWNYEQNQSVYSPICSCVYEDAPLNYLIDFSSTMNGAILLGLDAASDKIFWYQYANSGCSAAYNSRPIHLENTKFPAVQHRVENFSTRGTVMSGDNVLINGFVVSGPGTKTVVVRALGPSLDSFGVSSLLSQSDRQRYFCCDHEQQRAAGDTHAADDPKRFALRRFSGPGGGESDAVSAGVSGSGTGLQHCRFPHVERDQPWRTDGRELKGSDELLPNSKTETQEHYHASRSELH